MIEMKLTLLDALKITFQILFCIKLCFLHLLSNGLNGVSLIGVSSGFVINFCVAYLVKTESFDFIKCDIL